MDELLSKENLELRALVRDIANKHVRPVAAEMDRTGEYPWDVIKALQSNGLMGVWIPKEYGGKGMGKTNFGSVLVEELTAAGLRWAVLDPLGVWWGLRHSEDGKSAGIEVYQVRPFLRQGGAR